MHHVHVHVSRAHGSGKLVSASVHRSLSPIRKGGTLSTRPESSARLGAPSRNRSASIHSILAVLIAPQTDNACATCKAIIVLYFQGLVALRRGPGQALPCSSGEHLRPISLALRGWRKRILTLEQSAPSAVAFPLTHFTHTAQASSVVRARVLDGADTCQRCITAGSIVKTAEHLPVVTRGRRVPRAGPHMAWKHT